MKQLMIPELETQAPAKARQAWPLVKLGDVAPARPSKQEFLSGETVWEITLDQIESNTGKIINKRRSKVLNAPQSSNFVDQDNVLYSKLRPYLNKVIIPDEKGFATTELVPLFPDKNRLNKRFLLHFLMSPGFVSWATNTVAGAKMPRLTMSEFWQYPIPLPPLAEQQRIVARLDLAQRLIDQRKAQLALMDQLVQSLFYEMFGDPVKNEMGWEVKDLLEITNFENGDRSSSYPSGKDILDSGILFFGTQNIGSDGYFNPSDLKFISLEKFNSLSRGKLKQGDLVISLRGSVGNSCLFYSDKYLSGFINAQLMIIRPDSFIDNLYLLCYLRLDKTLSKLKEIASGSAVPQLTASQLKTFKVLFPPLSLQQTFADRVQQIEALKQQMQASLAELEQGFQALMQEAFGH